MPRDVQVNPVIPVGSNVVTVDAGGKGGRVGGLMANMQLQSVLGQAAQNNGAVTDDGVIQGADDKCCSLVRLSGSVFFRSLKLF